MAVKVPTIKFSNGVDFPLFGLGTWGAKDPEEVRKALDVALNIGYRHIDTAQLYQNEHIFGEILEEKIKSGQLKRFDVFITTKLAPLYHKPEKAEAAIQKSFENLRTDYIDLFLIHMPFPLESLAFGPNGPIPGQSKVADPLTPHIDTWRVLEKYYKLGKFKAIGISNFNEQQILDLYEKAEIKPQNLQVECHILWPQHELHALAKKLGMTFTSYSTLGSANTMSKAPYYVHPTEVPLVKDLAKKYNKKPAQILLHQMTQRGIAVIPKSTNPERLRQNISIFDFELSKDEMAQFDKLDQRVWLFRGFWEAAAKHHPWYPFHGI